MILRGRFPAEQGALIIKALEREMEREFREKPEEDVPAGTSCSREPMPTRRADALSAIAEISLNDAEDTGSTADRYQVVVHVPAGTS